MSIARDVAGRLEQRLQVAKDHASQAVPIVAPEMTVHEMLERLRGQRFDTAVEIVVCDAGRLVGLINLEDLLAASDGALARDLMDSQPAVAPKGMDQEVAVWQAIHRNESTFAVVDGDGNFMGLVPPPRLIEVLLSEHDEDMARLGGFLRSSQQARQASVEALPQRLWHRLPWLLLGLLGALLSAEIVGSFESQLRGNVLIAFFIPGVVYLADAVGTQTETVVVRGLSVGVPISKIHRREAATGALVGCLLAAAFVPIAILRWGRADLALAVGVSLATACSIASLVAMSLPGLFKLFGLDPAFGSGPLATAAQDLLSILVYFGVASVVMT